MTAFAQGHPGGNPVRRIVITGTRFSLGWSASHPLLFIFQRLLMAAGQDLEP